MDPQQNQNPVSTPAPAYQEPSHPTKERGSTKSKLLHIGVVLSLYIVTANLINILFAVIDKVFREAGSGYYYGYTSSISWPVSMIIVLFPVFIFLSWLAQKMYATDTEGKYTKGRRDVIYFNLAIAGAVIIGCLITVIYFFIDGQDITTAFLLKTVSLFLVSAVVLAYYAQELKNQLSSPERKAWVIASAILTVLVIIVGFLALGSPRALRAMRDDQTRIQNLQTIQSSIVRHWQSKNVLPQTIEQSQDSLGYYNLPTDPRTGVSYEYKVTGGTSFELCATFEANPDPASIRSYAAMSDFDRWDYKKGRTCFSRTIDPQLYQPYTKPAF